MSQNHSPVPRLDLAPKLRRPLSLLNPLDYLRLLYWVFFFPQALGWYVYKFGNKFILQEKKLWQKIWQLIRHNSIERQLILQGLVLIVAPLLAWAVLLLINGVNLDGISLGDVLVVSFCIVLFFPVTFGSICTWSVNEKYGIYHALTSGIASSIASGVAWPLILPFIIKIFLTANNYSSDLLLPIFLALIWGIAWNVAFSVVSGIGINIIRGCLASVPLAILFVGFGDLQELTFRITSTLKFLPLFIPFSALTILRAEDWIFNLFFNLLTPINKTRLFPHVTHLPIPGLESSLKQWLRQDWNTGLHNANELLKYTLQFIPVIKAINQVLAEFPDDQVIFRVSQLAEQPYDWNLLRFASENLSITTETYIFQPRLDTPAHATAAGFYYLYKKEPQKAAEAFRGVRSLLYGEEMFTLSQICEKFLQADQLATIALLQVPNSPKEPLLRSATWENINCLRGVIKDIQVVQRSGSTAAKTVALNRAIEAVQNVLKQAHTIPTPERDLICYIAYNWQEALFIVAEKIETFAINEPVRNPYIIGDPVEGKLFVGREDIIYRLEEIWILANQLQSVLLYGHRRMGKSSILRNISQSLGSQIQVAYINLLEVGDSFQGVGEILIWIADAISQAVKLPAPADDAFLTLPYLTFERYLKQVESNLQGGLIIALDEFEKIEQLIQVGKIPPDFMGVLRGMVQMSSKIAFALAGLHTLEEMTSDYFQPFYASIIPIKVDFLTPQATSQLLTNPTQDFPLSYTSEAIEEIYQLTAGQAYLVQLIGFQLVRLYNNQVFEKQIERQPVLTLEDVEEAIKNDEFYKWGRYYFTGVWGQAKQGNPHQQTLLKTLAPHPKGLTIEALIKTTGLNETTINNALDTLKRHDVVKQTDKNWHIIVELFRRWLLNN